MDGRSGHARGFVATRGRVGATLSVATLVALALAGCSSGQIVTTDAAPPATATSTSAPPPAAPPPTIDHLANAATYFAESGGRSGYFFISPSTRWTCAIFSRETAGCQSSTTTTIPIAGAPKTVPDASGADSAPNAIELARDGDVHFAALGPPGYAADPGPAAVLPFGKVLIVAGFQCNVQESTGVSCQSLLSGKGFTFSSDGYTSQYSDLPA